VNPERIPPPTLPHGVFERIDTGGSRPRLCVRGSVRCIPHLRLSNAGFLVRDSPGLWCKPVQAARGLARAARSPGRPVAELLCAPPLCCCCGSPPTEPRFEMHSRLRSERNAKRLIELRTLICAASWQQQQLSERAQHGCRASPRGPPPPRTLRHQPLEPG